MNAQSDARPLQNEHYSLPAEARLEIIDSVPGAHRHVARLLLATRYSSGAMDEWFGALRAALMTRVFQFAGEANAIEETTRYFSRDPTGSAVVESRLIDSRSGTETWRISVCDENGRLVAESTVSYARTAHQSGPREALRPELAPQRRPREVAVTTARAVSDERREQIVEGAFKVIAKKGFANSSMREIAEAAQMPVPTMYQYIGSKDELLPLIFERVAGSLNEELTMGLGQTGDATSALRKAIGRYFEYCETNRRGINLIYRETRNLAPDHRRKIFALDRSVVSAWTKIIKKGQREKVFCDGEPTLLAEFIYFTCTIWALRYWSLQSFGAERVLDGLLHFVLAAVSSKRSGAGPAER